MENLYDQNKDHEATFFSNHIKSEFDLLLYQDRASLVYNLPSLRQVELSRESCLANRQRQRADSHHILRLTEHIVVDEDIHNRTEIQCSQYPTSPSGLRARGNSTDFQRVA